MRGTDLSPLRPSAPPSRSICAMMAGAAILAGATLSAAQAQPGGSEAGALDDTAALAPNPQGFGGAALPRPLSPAEAARVRRIFAAQARDDIPAALRETGRLETTLLVGPILADRYLGTRYAASPAELVAWMRAHGDQPDYPAIQALLARSTKASHAARTTPGLKRPATDELDLLPRDLVRRPSLDRTVAERAHDGRFRSALHLIAATKGLSPAYALQLRAEVARAQFAANDDAGALETVASAMARTAAGDEVPLAAYVAGLSAWRLGHPDVARGYFEESYRAANGTPASRAAAAYWVSRAEGRVGRSVAATLWLRRAATAPRTFHGLIARDALGEPPHAHDVLTREDVDAIAATRAGLRAFALLQVDQRSRAVAAFASLKPRAARDALFARSLSLVSAAAGFADLAAQFANCAREAAAAPAPMPNLRPRGGFQVDPALVYALARLESNFDAGAVSRVGARGLMQLMPVTAGYVSGDVSFAHGGAKRLHDPAVNLDLGQRYVAYLAQHERVDGDLIRLLSCYNSGPANFVRWSAAVRDGGDPMMFVEAIPNDETRGFVQKVLTYTWLYAARLRLPTPSLDEISSGLWPRFTQPAKQASIIAFAPTLH